MREHKYRAWNTHKKEMYSAEQLGADQETLSVDGRGFINVHGSNTRLSQFHTHLLPLQYTGLKDKNGVEIYEGDIVEISHMEGGKRLVRTKTEVKWKNGYGNVFDSPTYYVPEVIGNIYENQELLKGVATNG